MPAGLASLVLPASMMVLLWAGSIASAAPATVISPAPLNPAFLQYLIGPPVGARTGTPDGRILGERPGPQDVATARRTEAPGGRLRGSLPASYDLRQVGRVSPVKDQNPYGTCWAFATCGSLESCLLPGEVRDFSEDHLVLTSGFDNGGDAYEWGGNIHMSSAYLVRRGGPVNETDDTYGDGYTPPGLLPRKYVDEVTWIPARASALDNDGIKDAVLRHGAVYAAMGWFGSSAGSSYYDPSTASYYYADGFINNHAVLIVGWDDGYAASNFATAPPGDGAFIVKNSWGSEWGDGGYFRVSYYDAAFGTSSHLAVFDHAQPTSAGAGIYQYDPLGYVTAVGLSDPTGWFANVFTAQASASVNAVGFYTLVPGSSYEIYTGSSLAAKTLRAAGTAESMGYHSVPLPSPVSVTGGERFAVAVKVTTPGYDWPIAIEKPVGNYSSAAAAEPGQSYISSTGASWTDLTTFDDYEDANVCLKAYVEPVVGVAPTVVSPNGGEDWRVGSDHGITWSTGDGDSVSVELSRDGGSSWETLWASTADDGSQTWTVQGQTTTRALVRVVNSSGGDSSDATFTISSPPGDVTPPTVTASGCDGAWHNRPVTVTLTGSDAGSGVACIWYSVGDRLWQQIMGARAEVTIPAPADHSWDGVHEIRYYGVDEAGNQPDAADNDCRVRIDTRRPATWAAGRVAVRRGRTAGIRYRVVDPAPNGGRATVTIRIREARGRTVRTLRLGEKPVNATLAARFRCGLARGAYRYSVYAKDSAGNLQGRVGSGAIRVR